MAFCPGCKKLNKDATNPDLRWVELQEGKRMITHPENRERVLADYRYCETCDWMSEDSTARYEAIFYNKKEFVAKVIVNTYEAKATWVKDHFDAFCVAKEGIDFTEDMYAFVSDGKTRHGYTNKSGD